MQSPCPSVAEIEQPNSKSSIKDRKGVGVLKEATVVFKCDRCKNTRRKFNDLDDVDWVEFDLVLSTEGWRAVRYGFYENGDSVNGLMVLLCPACSIEVASFLLPDTYPSNLPTLLPVSQSNES